MTKDITQILEKYKCNMDRQHELDKSLLQDMDRTEWIECLQERAVENQKMYIENGELLDSLMKLLDIPLQDDTAESLYKETYDMYWDGYDDCQVLLPMIYKLIDYYEKSEDISKLMFLYGAAFYEEGEVQNRREGYTLHDNSYMLKVINYKNLYFDTLDNTCRRRIWASYYNLIVSGLGNKTITAEDSYKYYAEAMDFWNSAEVQALDGHNEEIKEIVDRIKKEWLIVQEVVEELNAEAQQTFCKVAEEIYNEELVEYGNVYAVNSEVYAAYLHAQKILNKKSIEDIVDIYMDYYKENLKNSPKQEDMTEEYLYFLMNVPLTIENWLHLGIGEEKSKEVVNFLMKQTRETWYEKLNKFALPFINGVMAEWCFKLIKYMTSQDEKEECIFRLLVRRQLPTYLHSVMVSHLAEALCKEALRQRPEIFDGLPEETRNNIFEYVRRSALLHDIGKTKITDIVNTQGRKLLEREFQGIKNHPHFGAEMISQDIDLMKYKDVVLGHHKFYDGSAGYPTDFDNTASAYRVIIDLITICDCIDAATDHLGRNYKNAKTLDEVLGELIEGKGTRYNPDLVEIIEESPRLKKEMRYIVSDGRLDAMYRAYLESDL